MRRIIIFLLLSGIQLLPVTTSAKHVQSPDTVLSKVDQQQIESGLNTLMRYQEERKKKEKKAAMIRIGIGVFFLVVLVVGLARRRRRNQQ